MVSMTVVRAAAAPLLEVNICASPLSISLDVIIKRELSLL